MNKFNCAQGRDTQRLYLLVQSALPAMDRVLAVSPEELLADARPSPGKRAPTSQLLRSIERINSWIVWDAAGRRFLISACDARKKSSLSGASLSNTWRRR